MNLKSKHIIGSKNLYKSTSFAHILFCLDELCTADPSVAIGPKQAGPCTSAAADPAATAYFAAADSSATSYHGM